jgi:hypothetical protein
MIKTPRRPRLDSGESSLRGRSQRVPPTALSSAAEEPAASDEQNVRTRESRIRRGFPAPALGGAKSAPSGPATGQPLSATDRARAWVARVSGDVVRQGAGACPAGPFERDRGLLRGRLLGPFLAIVLSIPAVWLLLRPGFFLSDDGMFHLYRLAALDEAMHAGVIFPRWFPDFAFGYGFPVLNFYSPLGYYLAEVLHLLGGGMVLATKLALGASLALSALAMYLFAKQSLDPPGALLASLAYTYAPYHLADVYRRGALAESLAFVWFPLILWQGQRLLASRRYRDAVVLAVAIAGLILTHNLTAMIFMPLLAAYLLFVACRSQKSGHGRFHWTGWDRRILVLLAVALTLAAMLSAFYVLPVVAESRFAHLSYDFNSTGYARHLAPADGFISPFLLYRYFPDQGVAGEHPVGLAQVFLAAGSLLVVSSRIRSRKPWRHLAFWWAAMAVGVSMTLQWSLPVWQLAQPLLSMVQYPWRFMCLVDLGAAYLIGSLLATRDTETAGIIHAPSPRTDLGRYLVFAGAAVALMVNVLPNLATPAVALSDSDLSVQRMWDEDYAAGQIGATWTAEYLPLTVKEERWAIPRPPASPEAQAALPAGAIVTLRDAGLLVYDLDVQSPEAFSLRLHAFWFPGWQGLVDGEPAATYASGSLGLVTVDIPSGQHRVRLEFGDTAARSLGGMVTFLGLAIALVTLLVGAPRRWLAVGSVAVVVLLTGVYFWPAGTPTLEPRAAYLEDAVRLLGYRSEVQRTYASGNRLRVELYWMAARTLPGYKVFVHVTDAAGAIRAQQDGDPGGGYTPTTRWQPGEIVLDTHEFDLPSDLPSGRYTVLAGMYDFQTMRNLEARDTAGLAFPGARIPLGQITVEKR